MKSSLIALAAMFVVAASTPPARAGDSIDSLRNGFNAPPAAARPTVRWWWFGPAVVKPELEHEITLMHEGGFGGFEVQPTYPLALDGQYPGLKNIKFLSPEFYDMLGFTAEKAKATGLRMDLTLGSGWPYGGPMFTRPEAAQSIADGGTVTLAPGQTTVAPPPRTGRGIIPDAPVVAALLGPVKDAPAGASAYLPLSLQGRAAQLPPDLHGATQVRFFVYAPARLMQVKRAAFGAEGFIIDHYSRAAVDKFIQEIAAPEIAACGANPPYSIFCDSLEIEGEGWTPEFPAYFKQRYGYDLIPLLPALFDAHFPGAPEIRGDYGAAIATLFDEAFVDRFASLAKQNHTRFRLQAYGTPPTTLSTYARVDIDEGENYNWRLLSGTRWAASASHVLGRAVTSSEAFTWMHSPVFMAAPIDIKAESNLQFLNGVNQLLYHGWPYTAPGVEYPGWRFYAAAVFNEKNPWWIVMPDINQYLARTSFLLREGTPVNDVALYLPEEDAFTEMTPERLQMVQAGGNGILNQRVNALVPAILDAGFNFDGIDAGVLATHGQVEGATLAFGAMKYRVVVLPPMTHITPAALEKLTAFADGGGTLIALGAAPTKAPGYRATEADAAKVRDISERLFSGAHAKGLVIPANQLSATLRSKLHPDVVFAQPQTAIGVVHRHVDGGEIYFVANTTNQPVAAPASFRDGRAPAAWWDATNGKVTAAHVTTTSAASTTVAIDLAPYEAKFLVFGSPAVAATSGASTLRAEETLDVSTDWSVAFKNAAPEPAPANVHLTTLTSWTDLPELHYFSGVGTYSRTIDVPPTFFAAGRRQGLDFGTGEAAVVSGGRMGMRANFQPPVADAAVVYVNGQRAGALWCPPYRLDVTGLLHPGRNELRVDVANRACNFMADQQHHPLPDYHALNANRELGGNRFQPQDMADIAVTPSGLLGPVRIVSTSAP